jgi:hypothetical protein
MRVLQRWHDREDDDERAWNDLLGPLLSGEEVKRRIHARSLREVADLVRSGKLLSVPSQRDELVYPAFQFTKDGKVYPEIEVVIEILGEVVATPYSIASWFVGPKDYLEGQPPIRWLQLERDPAPVIAGAEATAARLSR